MSRRRQIAVVFGALLVVATVGSSPLASATPTACTVADETLGTSYGSLQAAQDAASPGDVISVRGTCVGVTMLTTDLTIVGHRAEGSPQATLDGGQAGTVLTVGFGVNVTITGLLITGGTSSGVQNGGNLTLNGTTRISGNSAYDGGGVYNGIGATLTLNGSSRISGNSAVHGGAGVYNNIATVILNGNSRISANTAAYGAGIYMQFDVGTVILAGNSRVNENTATQAGGGIYMADGSLGTVDGSARVWNNSPEDIYHAS